MSERYYPIIMAAISEYQVRIGIVWGPVGYADFCARFVGAGTSLMIIKTLEALYLEKMTKIRVRVKNP
jgi:hypothetical protein